MKKRKLLFCGLLLSTSYLTFINHEIDKLFKRNNEKYDEFNFIKDESIIEKIKTNRLVCDEWFSNSKKEEIYIKSYDGLKLHGYLINNLDTNKYLVIAHGLNANLFSSLDIAYYFEKLGYNSLIFDQRACGNSEGLYSTMGFKESFDLIQWINYLIEKKPNSSICLHGISMGSVSVCLALGTELPQNVKCAIADCGFTTLKDETKYRITQKYHIYPTILNSTINQILNKKVNITFDNVRPIDCIKNSKLPICFVHGTEDKLVPFSMCEELYNANKNSEKKFYPFKAKAHGQSKFDDNYYEVLNTFIKEYM